MQIDFDWDPDKERQNIRKHRIDFRRAASVFRDPNQIVIYDEAHSESEDRWVTIGVDNSGVLRVVVHTAEHLDVDLLRIRIISARKAEWPEIRQYQGDL